MDNISLYYRQGGSDKVYQASIDAKGGGFVVNFAFGRRGTTLQTGTKTQTPVPYEKAKVIFDKLIGEKSAKGYTPGEDGVPYQQSEKVSTGVYPQLLNPIEQQAADQLIKDPAYWMQEKKDGRRLMIQKTGSEIIGINRLGLAVALPSTLVEAASSVAHDFLVDGEAIGDTLYVFDILSSGDEDLRKQGYELRHRKLEELLKGIARPSMQSVETSKTPAEKSQHFQQLKAAGREGVVFKNTGAVYLAGRPATGGTQLKFKFYETASFIVSGVNAKRSVSLSLRDGEDTRAAGNVTIPPNHELPQVGQVIECRYLYAFKESGCIYQPVYLGPREDIPIEECATGQLKFKSDSE